MIDTTKDISVDSSVDGPELEPAPIAAPTSARRRLSAWLVPTLLAAAVGVGVLLTAGGGSRHTVAAPIPPSTYAVPAGATVVSTPAQLIAALAGPQADIVLADGSYDAPTYFADSNGSRLYAQHLGGAVLTAGLVVGGNSGSGGAIVEGLAFDVSDPSKVFQGGELQTWGPSGNDLQVLDCTFDGHGVIPIGLLASTEQGLVAQRLVFSHFTDEGLRASDDETVAYHAATPVISSISDISIDGVTRTPPGSSNGTAEAGLFIGQPVQDGVRRIRIRNVSLTGIETVNNSWDTTFSDLDIDMGGADQASGTAVYLEHFSRNDVFTDFTITGARTGFNGEWDDGTPGNAAMHDVTIEYGTIDSAGSTAAGHQAGVFLDQGSESTTVRHVTFENQNWAGIGAYLNTGSNSFEDNTFELTPPAVDTSTDHI